MATPRRYARLPFLIIVTVCVMQIAWWVYFQYAESGRVERSERVRLEALCYRALVSLAPIVTGTEDPHGLLARELSMREEFHELEVASVDRAAPAAPDGDAWRRGVPLDRWVKSAHDDGRDSRAVSVIRPTADAAALVRSTARRTRIMFASEGIAFTMLVLLGVVLLYRAHDSEMKVHRQHEGFLTGATHEMKTPLATIRLGLESLAQGWPEGATRERYLRQMLGQVDRLQLQIDNLVRSASGAEARLNRTAGDLSEDVRRVAAELQPRYDARGVQLVLDLAAHAPIRRDAEALLQLVRNLLDNALKFSPEGGAVRAHGGTTERDAWLRIEDQGPGVADGDGELIFERFYRGESQPANARGGSGLGLWLARQTASQHGGTLQLVPGSGCGACFELRLPIARDERRRA